MTSLDNYVTKTDLAAAIALLKAELKAEIADLRAEIHSLDARLARSINRRTYAVYRVVAMGAAVHFFR